MTVREKVSPNYVTQINGKKAVRVFQQLYGGHRYSVGRKCILAEQAAERFHADLGGDPINWATTTGEEYIRCDKNPQIKHSPWRVNGPDEFYVVQVATKELAIKARDRFSA